LRALLPSHSVIAGERGAMLVLSDEDGMGDATRKGITAYRESDVMRTVRAWTDVVKFMVKFQILRFHVISVFIQLPVFLHRFTSPVVYRPHRHSFYEAHPAYAPSIMFA
jgi:hypothetical protein